MLLTKEIMVKWASNKSKSYYINKGYEFTNFGDEFLIPVTDLPPNSNIIVEVMCDYCSISLSKQYGKYMRSINTSPISKDVCTKCHPLKTKEGNLLLYGVDHYTKLPHEREKVGNRKRLNQDYVAMEFKKKGLKLLTKTYRNSTQLLEYICEKHVEKGVQRGSWSNINHQNGCGYCGDEERVRKQRLSFEVVKKRCIELNYILLTNDEEYVNSKSALEVLCTRHSNLGVFKTTYDAMRYIQGCRVCYIERNSEAKSYNWKGGISSIKEYLRSKIKKWRKDSLKFHNYKCLITKNVANVVHHIYSFEYLLDLCLSQTGIPVKDNISKYSVEEKKILSDTIVELHYEYGFGAALTQEMHLLFHQLYGQHTTPEEFWEFIGQYAVK